MKLCPTTDSVEMNFQIDLMNNGSQNCVHVCMCRCTVSLCAAARTLCPGVSANCWLNSSRAQASSMTSSLTSEPSSHAAPLLPLPSPSNKESLSKKV